MAKFKNGSKVDFKRNSAVTAENTVIVSEVKKGAQTQLQQYVIEHDEYGWKPDAVRKKMYGLDEKKKYLFVTETELFEPGTIEKQTHNRLKEKNLPAKKL